MNKQKENNQKTMLMEKIGLKKRWVLSLEHGGFEAGRDPRAQEQQHRRLCSRQHEPQPREDLERTGQVHSSHQSKLHL